MFSTEPRTILGLIPLVIVRRLEAKPIKDEGVEFIPQGGRRQQLQRLRQGAVAIAGYMLYDVGECCR